MTQIDPRVLAVARAGLPGAPPPPRDGWDEHLDSLMAQGLAGLFSASAAAGMIDIDAEMAGRLQRQLDSEAVRAVQLEGELIRLAPALEHLGAVVLKGAVLAHAAYPDPLLRPFTDLDLLVPGDGVAHAISAFATHGYQRTRPEPSPGYDARVGKAVTLRHPGGVVIDLHRTLAAGNAGEGVDVHELLAAQRPIPIGAHSVPAPSWEAHLVECALHAVVGDGLARPLSLRDMAEVAHHPSLDPVVAAELALRWQVAELVGLGLRAARDGLGLELPNALAALAHRADITVPASEPARSAHSRLDELRTGDLRRRATLARSLVAPSADFLRWAHGDAPLPRLYGRRWRSLYERTLDARRGQPEAPPSTDGGLAADGNGTNPVPRTPPTGFLPEAARETPPSGSTLPVVSRRTAGTLERAAPASRQEAWSRARPPRQSATTNGNGRSPNASGGGVGSHVGDNGDGQGGGDDDGSGPPAGPAASDGDPTRGAAPAAPARNGLAFGIAGGALLTITAVGSQLGSKNLGIVLVPLAGLLLAGAASRRIARLRPDEAWVGRWLVLAVVVKIGASYYRYHTAVNEYGGIADASGYDEYGREFARAWLNGGSAPELDNLRQTNFIRWFTGVVYFVFGTNMVAGFFVFGLLALVGSYLWYRATVDAVPRVDKRLYLALVLFAPSVAFWPSSIGKESLMQLGIGTVALATAHLLRHRLARAAVLGLAGGWLLWVVRPHLLALVTLAAGCAYAGGRVRGRGGAMRSLMARPVGLLAVVFVIAFTVSQATKFLGIEDLSLSSIEQELDEQTERTSQGGSQFDNDSNSLNPINLPQGAATVLLRPFPWETESPLQLLASLESAVLAGIIVARLSSLRTSLARARSTPFLLYCWILVILYAATFSSFANFGLLVRQRSLVLPALFVLIAVRTTKTAARPGPRPPRRVRWLSPEAPVPASGLLRQAVKAAAAVADTAHRPGGGVVVLIYHRVGGGSGLELDLPVEVFAAQAEALAASGRVVPLGDALKWLDQAGRVAGNGAGSDPVVLTFDDGTADFVEHALPILERHRLPVTLYAATAFIDEGRPFPGDGRPVSWRGLADACATGLVEVGSHTHGHRLLDRLPPRDVDAELDRSIELITEHLGRPPLDFAYPKAVPGSAAADRAVRRRFRSAALDGTRPNPFGATDPYRLARSPIQHSDGMRWFEHKIRGGMALEAGLRRLVNRWRYAGATT